MLIRDLLHEQDNVINAAERFRKKDRDQSKASSDNRLSNAVLTAISDIIQPRWNTKYSHELIRKKFNNDFDYIEQLWNALPYPNEEMSPFNRIAHTIFMNYKDEIMKQLHEQLEQLEHLHAKFKGVIVFQRIISDYIAMNEMLINGFEDYLKITNK